MARKSVGSAKCILAALWNRLWSPSGGRPGSRRSQDTEDRIVSTRKIETVRGPWQAGGSGFRYHSVERVEA